MTLIPVRQFKIIITSSLPKSWDGFTEAYVGGQVEVEDTDPKKLLNIQQFIGILKEEYTRCQSQAQKAESVDQVNFLKQSHTKRLNTPDKRSQNQNLKCKQCSMKNHATKDCFHLEKLKCDESWCGYFRHNSNDCGKKRKWNTDKKNKGHQQNQLKKKKTNNEDQKTPMSMNVAEEVISYAKIEEVSQAEISYTGGKQYADFDLIEPVDFKEMEAKLQFYN
jgi:hypothetical protein